MYEHYYARVFSYILTGFRAARMPARAEFDSSFYENARVRFIVRTVLSPCSNRRYSVRAYRKRAGNASS